MGTRYEQAFWYPGPSDKVNGPARHGQGVVVHSAAGFRDGMMSRLLAPASSSNPVSWHFSILLDGAIYQHYDTTAQCWHARSVNGLYGGIECEGKKPEWPHITNEQLASLAGVLKWWGGTEGWDGFEFGRRLFEHNMFVQTSCPDGRIRWSELAGLLVPAPVTIAGLGAHYTDGGDEEIWTPRDGRELDGVGARWSDDTITRLWP